MLLCCITLSSSRENQGSAQELARRISGTVYFAIFTFNLYHKRPKIFIFSLLSLSDLTLVSDREGIDNPFIALVERFLFVCV